MKGLKDRNESAGSGEADSLSKTIKLMEASLIAWRESLEVAEPSESGRHLDRFLVSAREGYRQMAIKRGLGPDDTNDMAQSCVLGLIKRSQSGNRPPFLPSKIDAVLAEPTSFATAPTHFGSPLAAYLYVMLSNGIGAQDRLMRNRARREIATGSFEEDGAPSTDRPGSIRVMGTRPDNLIRKVSAAQNFAFAVRIQDDYLNSTTYKGTSLRVIFGTWTPMGEWTGRCSTSDRPPESVIPLRTLQRHIQNIQELIKQAKSQAIEMKLDPEDDPWAFLNSESGDVP
jgi:hypothetical protein